MASKVHPEDRDVEVGDDSFSATRRIIRASPLAKMRYALFLCIPFAWLLFLTLMDALTTDINLRDPSVSAPTVFIAFLLGECRDFACSFAGFASGAIGMDQSVPVHLQQEGATEQRSLMASLCAKLRRAFGCASAADDDLEAALAMESPRGVAPRGEQDDSARGGMLDGMWSVRVSGVVVHLVAGWYAAWRLATAAPSLVGREVAHCLLLYLGLLACTLLRWRAMSGLPERLADLEAEISEARVQYGALTKLLQRRDGNDDDLSEDEGDDREHLIVPPKSAAVPEADRGDPKRVLPFALNGLPFNKEVATKICKRIRKPNYSLAMFYDDVRAAFPELTLYLACREQKRREAEAEDGEGGGDGGAGKPAVTSGLTSDDEYRRTIGALFAVYWLMRIGIDGERGFSFGVDDQWRPHERPILEDGKSQARAPSVMSDKSRAKSTRFSLFGGPKKTGARTGPGGGEGGDGGGVDEPSMRPVAVMRDAGKRVAFHDTQDWPRLQQLLIDSGMIERDISAADGLKVNVDRTMAMLALTAFHDIMKVEALLPAVAPEHAPYLGFKEGDVINDHDIALGYVLDFNAYLLPSFAAMREHDQKTIRFTQSKMSFNHGWLVQGEAPPAPLFAKFKEVMQSDGVNPSDVAFYFVHWLTDLAGAEPSPLGGAEKFVLKFPHAVLDSFIRSFSVLNDLAVATETEVMERYLVRTWGETFPEMGPAPMDEDGVAIMRLALQAQTPDKQAAVLQAWRALPREDAQVLRDEMARTGIQNQMFEAGPRFKSVSGPAFLVYYSPAFIRTLSPTNAYEALRVLAEVYRRARGLWPLGKTSGNAHHVTIRIDQIKELKLPEIQSAFAQGESWLLCRKNDNEGVIERHTLEGMQEQTAKGIVNTVLKFWRLDRDAGSRGSVKSGISKGSRRSSKEVTFSAPSQSNGSVGNEVSVSAPNSEAGEAPQGLPPAELLAKKLEGKQ